jgi:hypothetical protein
MTIQNRIAASLMAAALFTGASSLYAQNPTQNQNTATAQDWNTPPAGTEQAGAYRDGIEAAKLDKLANRKVDAKASHLYVHPPVKGAAQAAYRTSFEQGYNAALKNSGGM